MTLDTGKGREQLLSEVALLQRRVAELVAEQGVSETQRQAHLRFLQSMERIDRAIRSAADLEQMLNEVISEVLSIFACDRAWLFYPCDPESPTWRVPVELTTPDYPGAFSLNRDIPTDDEIRQVMRISLASPEPVAWDPATGRMLPTIVSERFSVRSQVMTTVYPKAGKPWLFGLHQCTYARVWNDEERRLLQEIARRIADSLTSLLILRDLRASEERFRALTENTTDITVIFDGEGTCRYASPSVEKVFGYPTGEVIGQPPDRFLRPEDLPAVQETIRKAVAAPGRSVRLGCFGVRHGMGHLVFLDGIFVSMMDVPAVGGVVANCRDITERKLAEEENRQLRNLLSSIIDSMPSVLVGVDRDGKVTQWNREAARTTGISPERARGRKLTTLLPSYAGEMERMERAMHEQVAIRDEKRRRLVDGSTRFEDVTIYPLVADDIEDVEGVGSDVDGAVIRIDDVTEQVRIEEMIIQSEKMLSIGGLAAGMAHEINNPLAAILQSVQVLKNRVCGDLPGNRSIAEECGTTMEAIAGYMDRRRVLHMIDTIISSGMRASHIVENMLSFSRKGEPQLEPHDLGILLERTVELASNDYNLKQHYDFREIEIVREYTPLPCPVHCEAGKIQQVLLNLLTNGAHAMYSNPDQQHPARFILRVLPDGDMARIEIEDNGPGMDDQARKRVFEPFFTTKKGIGTGLGLSVSYFIVTENHGGTLAVESLPGHGTKFIVRLPLNGKESSPEQVSPAPD